MDNLNNIPNAGNWGDASSKLNDNFNKIKQSLTTVENTSKNNKGYFTSLSALNTAFPSPKAGQTAYVYGEASSTNYYIYNAVNGAWVSSTVEAPSVGVDLAEYTKTGGSAKTLKEVDDGLAQLAGDLKEYAKSEKTIAPTYFLNGTIEDNVITDAESSRNIYYAEVKKGDLFQIKGESTSARAVIVGYSLGVPEIGTILSDNITESGLTIDFIVEAPYDGYITIYMFDSWDYFYIYKVESLAESIDTFENSFYAEKIIRAEKKGITTPINANPNSPNFGLEDYSYTSYGATDFIEVEGFKAISLNVAEASTASIQDRGLVFYDKDKNPIIEGALPITHSPSGRTSLKTISIPAGAYYVRATILPDSIDVHLLADVSEGLSNKSSKIYRDVTSDIGEWGAGGKTSIGDNIVIKTNEYNKHLSEITINTPTSGQRVYLPIASLVPKNKYRFTIKYDNTSSTDSYSFDFSSHFQDESYFRNFMESFKANAENETLVMEFTLPDANVNYIQMSTSGFSAGAIVTIKDFKVEEVVEKIGYREPFKIITPNITIGKIVDTVKTSPTFGDVIDATNNTWSVSEAVRLYDATHIKTHIILTSGSANYGGVTGHVFYDNNMIPLDEGSFVMAITSARAEDKILIVPKGAAFFRFVSWGTSEDIVLMKDKDSFLVPSLPDNNKSISDNLILQQMNFVNSTKRLEGNLSLLHFSDLHGDREASKNIREYFDTYREYIDDMVSTGDITTYYYSDGFDFYKDNKLTDALFSLGNHDGATVDGPNKEGSADWNGIGAKGSYDAFFKPYIDGWGVEQPLNADANGLCYFHKDYVDAKIRLINLDGVIHFDEDYLNNQVQWFQDRLDELLNPLHSAYTYTLVVMSHYIPGDFEKEDIITRSDGDRSTFHAHVLNRIQADSRFKLNSAYPEAVESYISAGGSFAIWLSGHYHTDILYRPTLYPNIFASSINQSGNNSATLSRSPNQEYRLGGFDNHVANVVTIDTTNGVVKLKRVGCNIDKYLRPINVLTYDYKNKKIITNY